MSTDLTNIITSKIESLPTLPTVAIQIMQTTANPNSTAKDIMDIINPDLSLTTKILKIANSPFYGLSNEINSLQHAVTILGFKEIKNLVLSTVVFDSFKNIRKSKNFDIKKFWKHSFVSGIAANIFASELKQASNEFFVAALIHDIGKLAIYIALPKEFFALVDITETLKLKFMVFQAEEDILGITHEKVGMSLLKKWNFPESLVTAVGFHHHPQETDKDKLLTFVVHIADIFAHIHGMEPGDEESGPSSIGPVYADIIKMAKSHKIKWKESDLGRIQKSLSENIEKEGDTLDLFF